MHTTSDEAIVNFQRMLKNTVDTTPKKIPDIVVEWEGTRAGVVTPIGGYADVYKFKSTIYDADVKSTLADGPVCCIEIWDERTTFRISRNYFGVVDGKFLFGTTKKDHYAIMSAIGKMAGVEHKLFDR